MGIMSIVKNVIEHFRKAGKTENEISGMIEQAADRATVNKGVTEKKEYNQGRNIGRTVRRGSHANGCHSGAGKNGNYENVRFAKMHKSPKHE